MWKILRALAMFAFASAIFYMGMSRLLAKPLPEGTALSWLLALAAVFVLIAIFAGGLRLVSRLLRSN
jgi:hypothetical protein